MFINGTQQKLPHTTSWYCSEYKLFVCSGYLRFWPYSTTLRTLLHAVIKRSIENDISSRYHTTLHWEHEVTPELECLSWHPTKAPTYPRLECYHAECKSFVCPGYLGFPLLYSTRKVQKSPRGWGKKYSPDNGGSMT